jgi:hypothetical protein
MCVAWGADRKDAALHNIRKALRKYDRKVETQVSSRGDEGDKNEFLFVGLVLSRQDQCPNQEDSGGLQNVRPL